MDITERLQKNVVIVHCPECNKYLKPPRTWIRAELESKELLMYCIHMLNLDLVFLTDAVFLWTEPHSKRIKVKLTVQRKVGNGPILEQSYVVTYVVHEQMCDSCTRVQANPDQWAAAVQLRQRVSHRQAFLYLEQQILKHNAASRCIRIKQVYQGIDFFFSNRNHAMKFVEFLSKVAPVKYRSEMSHVTKSNNYTFSVEMSPICREDLVCFPRKVAVGLGNLGQLVICTRISSSIALMNPFTLKHGLLDANQYFMSPFKSLLSSRQLVEYVVLNVKPALDVEPASREATVCGSRYVLADAEVARVSDFGTIFNVRTHLGLILKPGDYALGYDLCGINSNDIEKDNLLHDVVLIKKSYEEKRRKRRGKPRAWKLKSLAMDDDSSTAKDRDYEERKEMEYERFKWDLEENPDMWFNVSLYRNEEYQPSEMAPDDDEVPSIPLEVLFADLGLRDDEDDLIMAG